MNRQLRLVMIVSVLLFSLTFTAAAIPNLGTFQKDKCVQLIQTCANCTYNNITSVLLPNSTPVIGERVMTASGSEYTFNFCNATVNGNYIVNGRGNPDGSTAIWAYSFEVTPTGKDVEEVGSFLGILVLIIFSIACFFLFLTTRVEQPGFKIFFLLISFLFLMGSIAVSIVITSNSGLPESIGDTLGTILYVLGIILIILFFFVMIRQTVAALELFRSRKGYASSTMQTGSGYQVMGRRDFY